MNRKRAMLILLSGAIGLLVTLVAARIFSSGGGPAEPKLEPIILMTTNMAQGEMLKKEDVELTSWPAPLRPAAAAAKVQEVEGRVAMSDLLKGEPVLLAKLAPEGSSPGLASRIDPGMRAMTIRVNEVIGVAGFLLPMSRVDVLATLELDDRGGRRGTISKLVLQNVEVLAVGQRLESRDSKAKKVSVVTLLVTPAQAERLSLAATKGSIFLTLRNNRDETSANTPGITAPQLIYGGAPGTAPGEGIEVIRGVERSHEAMPQ